MSKMQFNEKDIKSIIQACEYYKFTFKDGTYDTIIKKLHNYEEEYDCPGCWDPTLEHTCII